MNDPCVQCALIEIYIPDKMNESMNDKGRHRAAKRQLKKNYIRCNMRSNETTD